MQQPYHLYIKDDLAAITDEALAHALASLPQWRRAQALRFKHRQGRLECAFSYLLLCQALRETYGITQQPSFSLGAHGKPELLFPDTPYGSSPLGGIRGGLHFNLSHCRSALACVVSSRPVGIDVECIGRYNESLARHVLSPDEFALVSSAPDPQIPFTRLWTQKEAIVKLTGRGIDDDLSNLLFKYNNVCLHTEDHLDKGYILTIATFTPH